MKVQEISMNKSNTIWVGSSQDTTAPGYGRNNTVKDASEALRDFGADKIILSFKSHFNTTREKDIKTFSRRALKIATLAGYKLSGKAKNLVIDGYVQETSYIIGAFREDTNSKNTI